MKLPKLLAALALLAAPALAFAHPGHGEHGLVAGLAHPLTGLDHLLAMFAVGLWAAQQQGAARLALPCTFVGTMLVGGLLGFEGLQLPFMETGIAASVLALGLCVALAVRPPLPLAMAATALFALAHGVAHGLELPALSSPWLYALGFVAATAALHAAGYALVRFLPQARPWYVSPGWPRRAPGSGCWPAEPPRLPSAPDQHPSALVHEAQAMGLCQHRQGQRQVVDGKGAGDTEAGPATARTRCSRRRSASVLPPTAAAACRRPPAGPGARPARPRWRTRRGRSAGDRSAPAGQPRSPGHPPRSRRPPDAPGPRLRTPPALSLRPRVGR